MTSITIDGKPADIYHARLVTYEVGSTQIETDTLQSVQAITRYLFSCSEGSRTLTVTMEVTDPTEQGAALFLSHLTAALIGQHQIGIGDGYVYDSILTGISDPEQLLRNRFYIDYTFNVIRCGQEEAVTLRSTSELLYCKSTARRTPFVLTIVPRANISTMTIFGVTITGLQSGETFELNSVKKTVTSGGENAFERVALVDNSDFPTLSRGFNTPAVKDYSAAVTVRYQPIYI